MVNATVIVHDEIVRERLLKAAPRIMATNRSLVTSMLEEVKPVVVRDTPLGPGHFGEHGRDTVRIQISTKGVSTMGRLVAAVQLYWREFGTGMRFRARGKAAQLKQATRVMTGATGGEPARLVATHALNATMRFIRFYYNGMANWWNS